MCVNIANDRDSCGWKSSFSTSPRLYLSHCMCGLVWTITTIKTDVSHVLLHSIWHSDTMRSIKLKFLIEFVVFFWIFWSYFNKTKSEKWTSNSIDQCEKNIAENDGNFEIIYLNSLWLQTVCYCYNRWKWTDSFHGFNSIEMLSIDLDQQMSYSDHDWTSAYVVVEQSKNKQKIVICFHFNLWKRPKKTSRLILQISKIRM